jgi:hypothetical protein
LGPHDAAMSRQAKSHQHREPPGETNLDRAVNPSLQL